MAKDDKPKGEKPSQQSTIEDREARIKSLQKSIEFEEEQLEVLQQLEKTRRNLEQIEEKELEIATKSLKLQKEHLVLRKQLNTISEEDFKAGMKEIAQKQEIIEQNRRLADGLKELKGGFLGVVASSVLAQTGLSNFYSNVQRGYGILESAGLGIVNVMKKAFTDLFDLQAQTAQTGVSMWDDKNAYKFLGVIKGVNGELTSLTRFGIGFKQFQQAMNGLRDSMIDFSNESTEVQASLAGNAARMKNLGVDLATAGKNFNLLTRSMGVAAKDIPRINDQLARAGLGAGISAKKMLTDFSSFGPQLSLHGERGIQVFTQLAKQAKGLGVEVSTLMDTFGNAMDTFEGAASAAGKFNAVMGGDYLNSIELLGATEDERVRLVRSAWQATGRSISSMEKFEKIAVANALGIKDVSKVQAILAGTTDDLDEAENKREATQERLMQLQEQSVSVMERLLTAVESIAGAMAPLAKALEDLVSLVMQFNDAKNGLPGIILSGGLFAGSMMKMAFNTVKSGDALKYQKLQATAAMNEGKAYAEILKREGAATKNLTIQQKALAQAHLEVSKSSRGVSGIFTKLSAGFQVITGLLPIAIQLYEYFTGKQLDLFKLLHRKESPAFWEMLTSIIPAGFERMGEAINKAAWPTIKFGFGVALIGAAIWAAAYGLTGFVKAFKDLNNEQLIAVTISLGFLAAGFYAIGAAMRSIGQAGASAAPGMIEFGVGVALIVAPIAALVWAFSKIIESIGGMIKGKSAEEVFKMAGAITALGVAITGFNAIMTGNLLFAPFSGFGNWRVVKMIDAIGEAIERLPMDKTFNFKVVAESLHGILNNIKEIKAEDYKPTVDFMKEAQGFMANTSIETDNKIVKILNEILELAKMNTEKPSEKSGISDRETYEIKLNEAVFGELVKKYSQGTKTAARAMGG